MRGELQRLVREKIANKLLLYVVVSVSAKLAANRLLGPANKIDVKNI